MLLTQSEFSLYYKVKYLLLNVIRKHLIFFKVLQRQLTQVNSLLPQIKL